MIWLLSTAGLYSLHALRHPHVTVARAKTPEPPPQIVQTQVVQTPVVQTPVVLSFPSLELEGLTINGARSSALINGQVLFIGDAIGMVELVSVDEDQVTVCMGGQTNVLKLHW
jgi:hypothetical protein